MYKWTSTRNRVRPITPDDRRPDGVYKSLHETVSSSPFVYVRNDVYQSIIRRITENGRPSLTSTIERDLRVINANRIRDNETKRA